MRVGLSLLTLDPRHLGWERDLRPGARPARSPASGTHEYLALVPPLAPEAGDGLPTVVADRYPSSTSTAGRLRAMGAATVRPAQAARVARGT